MRQRPPRLRVGKPSAIPRAWVEAKDKRGSAHSRGYGASWRKLREAVLDAEPLCRWCSQRGRVTPAQEVDHIIPLRDGGTNELDNLQPLCDLHHRQKTAMDVKSRSCNRAAESVGNVLSSGARRPGGLAKSLFGLEDQFGHLSARGSQKNKGGA